MIGRTNTGGGGGGIGMIVVTYPAGSTLTISGGRTSKKDINSTTRIYYVKDLATYTITASLLEKTASRTVQISSLGQSVTIAISYALYIIHSGIIQSGFATQCAGKRYNDSATGSVSPSETARSGYIEVRSATYYNARRGSLYSVGAENSGSIVVINPSVVQGFTSLKIKCQRYMGASGAYMTVGSYYGSGTNAVDNFLDASPEVNNLSDSEPVTLSIPLTSATKASSGFYVSFAYSVPTSGGPYGIDIHDIWVE